MASTVHSSITVINGMILLELSAFPTSLTSPHDSATWLEIVRVMPCHSLFDLTTTGRWFVDSCRIMQSERWVSQVVPGLAYDISRSL